MPPTSSRALVVGGVMPWVVCCGAGWSLLVLLAADVRLSR